MRVIETSIEEDLSMFSRYLWQQRVRHRIYEESGRQVLEVADPAAVDLVRGAYHAWRSGELVLEAGPAGYPALAERLARLLAIVRRYPVLVSVLGLAVLVYPFSAPVADGRLTAVTAWLTIVDLDTTAEPTLALLLSREVWRLITPIFLHFSVVHLLFNVAVTTDFGRRIESGRGPVIFALIVAIIGILSNVGQYLISGNPLFGGLSGVAYGLLGYVLVSQRRFPQEAPWHVHPGFAFSLILFLVIFSTGVTEQFGLHVANAAHWIGLGSGAVLAVLVPRRRAGDQR